MADVGFEDVLGGFDLDYNDNRFRFTGVTGNDPPVANPDAYSTAEDVALTVSAPGVLSNDTDVDADALTAAVVSGPSHGSVGLNGDGSFTYTPTPDYNGPDSFTYRANDGTLDSNLAVVNLTVEARNDPPVCSGITADASVLWPPNHVLRLLTLSGATDVDGDPVSISVTSVTQDEPVNGLGDGDTGPDAAVGQQPAQVLLRAERSGGGNGRVYVVHFTGADGRGANCSAAITVTVPHSQGPRGSAIDSGQTFNSFGA